MARGHTGGGVPASGDSSDNDQGGFVDDEGGFDDDDGGDAGGQHHSQHQHGQHQHGPTSSTLPVHAPLGTTAAIDAMLTICPKL